MIGDDLIYQAQLYDFNNLEEKKKEKICVIPSVTLQSLSAPRGYFENAIVELYCKEAINKDSVLAAINTNYDDKVPSESKHWMLCHFQLNAKEIRIYNSAQNCKLSERSRKAITNFIIALHATSGREAPLDEYHIRYVDTPQQTNGRDCGLFPIDIAKSIMEQTSLSNANEIQGTRRHLKEKLKDLGEIYNGRITGITKKDLREMNKIAKKVFERNKEYVFKQKEKSCHNDLNNSDRDNNWTMCDRNDSCQLHESSDQVFCIICRKWLHLCCPEVENDEDKSKNGNLIEHHKFFICKRCNE